MKNKKRKSIIWKLTKDELQKLINESSTYSEVLRKLNIQVHTSYFNMLYKKIEEENIDLLLFNKNKKEYTDKQISRVIKNNSFPDEMFFIENCLRNRKDMKRRILKNRILPYECDICKNKGEWNNSILTLQIDHINGISNDNRIENIRFLCPNCHSQTDTYTGKNKAGQKICSCGKKIHRRSTFCHSCAKKNKSGKFKPKKTKINWPDKETLKRLVFEKPLTSLSKDLGVSDNAIRKHCILNNIELPKQGFWLKGIQPNKNKIIKD